MSERLRRAFIDRYVPQQGQITEQVKQADEAIKTVVTSIPRNKSLYAAGIVILSTVIVVAVWAALSVHPNSTAPADRLHASMAFFRASRTADALAGDAFFTSRTLGQNTVGFDFVKELDLSKKTFGFTLSQNLSHVKIIAKDRTYASNARAPLTLTTKGNGQFIVDRSVIDALAAALVDPYRIKEIRVILPSDVSVKQAS